GPPASQRDTPVISLRELRAFLYCPAEAALKRHLKLDDDEEIEDADDEPFRTADATGRRLVRTFLEQFLLRAVQGSVDEAVQQWRERFTALYDEWRLRCRVPEEIFGEIDHASFESQLQTRL